MCILPGTSEAFNFENVHEQQFFTLPLLQSVSLAHPLSAELLSEQPSSNLTCNSLSIFSP